MRLVRAAAAVEAAKNGGPAVTQNLQATVDAAIANGTSMGLNNKYTWLEHKALADWYCSKIMPTAHARLVTHVIARHEGMREHRSVSDSVVGGKIYNCMLSQGAPSSSHYLTSHPFSCFYSILSVLRSPKREKA